MPKGDIFGREKTKETLDRFFSPKPLTDMIVGKRPEPPIEELSDEEPVEPGEENAKA